ncbi:hypothetical protein ASE25_17115 [Terrabacter sp. Root85]|uniref:oxamate carbamoyltransferase subunit AllH family protein n=1 Tax=Terrabacter sp. Root85 TaxID=1736603 RepID=UPI0006F997E1|nr:DUF2877 domain-containing protein [Terrabacter sp. Root85]KRC87452.1 hypothetical protein ASE25_17115 [Terrabacter sp. Root85]
MDDLDLTLLPAAVSPLVAGEVAGTPRRCRVLSAFPTCLYLDLGAHERVLAVLASDAVALPIGVRLALPSSEIRWGVEPGAHVVVGEGRVRLPRADVVAARLLRPARVRPAPRGSAGDGWLPEPGVLGDLAHDLAAAALAGRSADPGVRGLVGVGRGLTPSGDDALCGVLLTLAAVDAPPARRALSAVRTAVRSVLPWTTSLSAALLVAAGAGYAVPDVARLVTRLVSGPGSTNRSAGATPGLSRAGAPSNLLVDPAEGSDVGGLVDRVLAIGHTSGRDLLSGVSGALRAVDALDSVPRPEPRPAPRPESQEGLHRG